MHIALTAPETVALSRQCVRASGSIGSGGFLEQLDRLEHFVDVARRP